MKCLYVVLISILASSAAVHAYSCGGLLEGDAGELQFPIEGNADGESNCLWIIKLLSGNGIRFTLTKLGSAGVVSLYPEHEASETTLTPIRLEAAAVNSTVLATGKVLIVTLSKSSSSSGVSFTWESDTESNTGAVRAASYVDTPEGRVSFSKFGQAERLTFGLGVDPSENLKVHATTDFGRCNLLDPCMCTYFALYEVTPEGYLREATRVCGRPSEAEIENLYSQLVAFIYVNTTGADDPTTAVELTWISSSSDEVTTTTTTTETTTTTTPAPPTQQLECGGIINIDYTYGNPEVFYVEYKLDTFYEDNEFCVWTITSTGDVWSDLEVALFEDLFAQDGDGLDSYYLSFQSNSDSRLEKCSFSKSNRSCYLLNGVGFLAFSSDSSVRAGGFRAALAPLGTLSTPHSYFHFAEPEVVFNYPMGGGNYLNYDRVSMVFQRNGPNYLELTRLQTEVTYDRVDVYTIYPYYNATAPLLDGSYAGDFPDGRPGSLTFSNTPRIAIFTSDSSNVRQGFEITLRSEPESQTTEAPTTTSAPLPPVQQLECGGIINIDYTYGNPQVFYVEYKLDTVYDSDEFCVWTINSTGDIWRYLEVTMVEEHFELGYDGLDSYYLSFNSPSISTLETCSFSPFNLTCNLESSVNFLAFSSDSAVQKSGFRLALTPSGITTDPRAHFHSAEPEVVFNYPIGGGLYPNYDRVSMVFQQTNINYLEVTRLETESSYDKLSVYTLSPYYSNAPARLDGTYSGYYPNGVPGSLSSANRPRIAVFHSDGSNTGLGFEITLRKEPESQTTEAPLPPAIQLGCGGIINVPSPGTISVEYKVDTFYDNEEFCLWPIYAENRWGNATVSLVSGEFEECCDGIDVYYLNSTNSPRTVGLSKCRLQGNSCTLENGVGFIAFSSDYSNVRRGFRLEITTTAPTETASDYLFHFDSSNGTWKFPQTGVYPSNTRVLATMQTFGSAYLKLDSLNTELSYHYVHFFSISEYKFGAQAVLDGKWSGAYPNGPADSVSYSSPPRVVLFVSDSINRGTGFEVEWGLEARNSSVRHEVKVSASPIKNTHQASDSTKVSGTSK